MSHPARRSKLLRRVGPFGRAGNNYCKAFPVRHARGRNDPRPHQTGKTHHKAVQRRTAAHPPAGRAATWPNPPQRARFAASSDTAQTTGCRVAGRRSKGRMLGLTPDPLSAGVGMHVAVAGPYTATNGSPRDRTMQTRNGRIPAGGSVSSGRARAPDGALARLSQTTVCPARGCRRKVCFRRRPACTACRVR